MPLIEQFNLEFDRASQRVGFQAHFAGSVFAVPGDLTPGFSVAFRDGRCAVRNVVPGMQPADEGMEPGDAIVGIDNRRAAGLDYRAWDRLVRNRQPIVVSWEHGSRVQSATFPIVELR
jgi:hypothetical protein